MTHPITPPPELVQQWWDGTHGAFYEFEAVTAIAAQWGADAELEAIQKEIITQAWFADPGYRLANLRAARRPKPPSFKEQALAILASVAVCELHGDAAPDNRLSTKDIDTIRRALEALPE